MKNYFKNEQKKNQFIINKIDVYLIAKFNNHFNGTFKK